MGATKATLIVVGTLGGLGAVLAYSPPHQSLNLGGNLKGLGGGGVPSSTPTPTQTQSTAPQVASTPSATPTPTVATTPVKNTPAPKQTAVKPKPKPVVPKKTVPPAPKLISGTFSGATSLTVYGPVQVQIDVKDSKIVAARALQLPSGTPLDAQIDAQAVPILISETVAASSSDIQGVSGASYTSQGWYDSLVSALANAGL